MEETDKKETILHFIYIRDENAKLNEYVEYVQLEKANIKVDFFSSNDILFDFQLEENNLYYDEVINIIFKKNLIINKFLLNIQFIKIKLIIFI